MNQPFSLSFTLAENMEVSGATFVNGLLHIDLIRNEPEPSQRSVSLSANVPR